MEYRDVPVMIISSDIGSVWFDIHVTTLSTAYVKTGPWYRLAYSMLQYLTVSKLNVSYPIDCI
jgi:hypothetical protein